MIYSLAFSNRDVQFTSIEREREKKKKKETEPSRVKETFFTHHHATHRQLTHPCLAARVHKRACTI